MTKFKFSMALMMSIVMGSVPVFAASNGGMISTSAVVAELSRSQMEQSVQNAVKHEDVRKELLKNGIAPEEVSKRVASLSDSELRQLSGQLEQARAGGDILVTILVVVLIIFLVRRI